MLIKFTFDYFTGRILGMKQAIIALIRPKLNFAQKESQAAHLIEHILVTPGRLKAMGISDDFYAQNIIYHSGVVNDFYMAEYFIVRLEAAKSLAKIISKNQDELFMDESEFIKIRSVLIEEIAEARGEYMETSEQFSRAIYQPGSPSIANPWNDLESIKDITLDEVKEIFRKNNTNLSLLELSFESVKYNDISTIQKNNLKNDIKSIELTHPWQSLDSVDTSIIISFDKPIDPYKGLIYSKSLTDFRFGLLTEQIRRKNGLVYDISTTLDHSTNSIDIYFNSNLENIDEIIDLILASLNNYDSYIDKNIELIKERIKLKTELDWGDVQNCALSIIDDFIMGGSKDNPIENLRKIMKITASDLKSFNLEFVRQIEANSILVKRSFGSALDLVGVDGQV